LSYFDADEELTNEWVCRISFSLFIMLFYLVKTSHMSIRGVVVVMGK